MMWSVEQGATTSVMATSNKVEGVKGKFYSKCKEKTIKLKYQYEVDGRKVWDYRMEICDPYFE